MPLYEYECLHCSVKFEMLVQRWGDGVSCPACSSARVEKQLSTFAVSSAGGSEALDGCGMTGGGCGAPACGGGTCARPS